MRWHNGAKSAFALGFDMDGDTIWRNKTRCLPNGDSYIKGPSIGQYGQYCDGAPGCGGEDSGPGA